MRQHKYSIHDYVHKCYIDMIENTVVFTITDVSDSRVSSQWRLHPSQLLLAKLSSGVINVSAAFVYMNSSSKTSNSVHQLLLVSGLDLLTYILLKFVPKIFDGIHVQ